MTRMLDKLGIDLMKVEEVFHLTKFVEGFFFILQRFMNYLSLLLPSRVIGIDLVGLTGYAS